MSWTVIFGTLFGAVVVATGGFLCWIAHTLKKGTEEMDAALERMRREDPDGSDW